MAKLVLVSLSAYRVQGCPACPRLTWLDQRLNVVVVVVVLCVLKESLSRAGLVMRPLWVIFGEWWQGF